MTTLKEVDEFYKKNHCYPSRIMAKAWLIRMLLRNFPPYHNKDLDTIKTLEVTDRDLELKIYRCEDAEEVIVF